MADQGERHCIFCGATADDKEHLLPRWLQEVLPSDQTVIHTRQVGGEKTPPWSRKPFREKAKFVCEGCNQGWMSELESEAKPLLTPVIARKGPCDFDLVGQWTIARWAVKTCFVMQMQGPEQLTRRMHPVLLNLNIMPPPQVTVWIGSHHRAVQDPINSVYIQQPLWLASDGNSGESRREFGYMSFLAVGGMSFLLVEHRFGGYVECVLGEDHPSSQMFTKIWPRTRKVASWPPYLMADRELIDLIFDPDTLPLGFDARLFPGRLHEEPLRNVF
jgi:hypothetical protein